MKSKIFLAIAACLALALTVSAAVAITEHGVTTNRGTNVTKTYAGVTSITAGGGNISRMNITMELQAAYWAGFHGNISHSLVLAGGTTNFYSWTGSFASTGYVLFANGTVTDWSQVTGTSATHATQEDTYLGTSAQPNNVTRTFALTNNVALALTNTIAPGAAMSVNTSNGTRNVWQTVLLRSTAQNVKVYAGIINQNARNYAGSSVDYQVMVPVRASTQQRTYYMYAALQ
jgi:hypothetical protein